MVFKWLVPMSNVERFAHPTEEPKDEATPTRPAELQVSANAGSVSLDWESVRGKLLECGEGSEKKDRAYALLAGNDTFIWASRPAETIFVVNVEVKGGRLLSTSAISGQTEKKELEIISILYDSNNSKTEEKYANWARADALKDLYQNKVKFSFQGVDYMLPRKFEDYKNSSIWMTDFDLSRVDNAQMKLVHRTIAKLYGNEKNLRSEAICAISNENFDKSSANSNASPTSSDPSSSQATCLDYIINNPIDKRMVVDKNHVDSVKMDCKTPKVAVCMHRKILKARQSMADDDLISPAVLQEWQAECE